MEYTAVHSVRYIQRAPAERKEKPVKTLLPILFAALCLAPASAAADAPPDLPNPLLRLRAGQWTRYRVHTLFGEAEQRQTVVSTAGEGDDRLVRIRTEMSLDGEVVDEREETSTYAKLLSEQSAALEGAEETTVEACEVTVGGVTFAATAVRYTQDGMRYALFLSGDVPLAGVLLLTAGDGETPVMELLDFGED